MSETQSPYQSVERSRAEGKTVKEACKEAGISQPTYYKHKRKAGRNGADMGAQEWGEQFEAAAQSGPNPAQEMDRLSRLVAAQGAILSQAGIFVSVK